MINKLYELTQSDVDTKLDIAGIVNPSKVTARSTAPNKLSWGYPLVANNGEVIPTSPTLIGDNSWTHNIISSSDYWGKTLPGIGYSALMPLNGYFEIGLELPQGASDFTFILSGGPPGLSMVFGDSSVAYVNIRVSSIGISFNTSSQSATVSVPNTGSITHFGIGYPDGVPHVFVNGVGTAMPLDIPPGHLSITTAYMGRVGDILTVTMDTSSKTHMDPAYLDKLSTFIELNTITSTYEYGVPEVGPAYDTFDSTSNSAAYPISPKLLNAWLSRAPTGRSNYNAIPYSGVDTATPTEYMYTMLHADVVAGKDPLFYVDSMGVNDSAQINIPTEYNIYGLRSLETIRFSNFTGNGSIILATPFGGPTTLKGRGSLVARKLSKDTWAVTVEQDIPELTPDDIANKTDRKGLVSGADLGQLGGSFKSWVPVWSGSATAVALTGFYTTPGFYRIKVARSASVTSSHSFIDILLTGVDDYQTGGYAPLFDLSVRTYNGSLYGWASGAQTPILQIYRADM